jgi:hypothetical protein
MFEASKTTQLAREMKQYNINILGISEVCWTGSEKKDLQVVVRRPSYTWTKIKVAIMMSKETSKTLIE